MKKLIQIAFVTVLFLSLNVQFIYSQFYSDPLKKIEKLVKADMAGSDDPGTHMAEQRIAYEYDEHDHEGPSDRSAETL